MLTALSITRWREGLLHVLQHGLLCHQGVDPLSKGDLKHIHYAKAGLPAKSANCHLSMLGIRTLKCG